MDENSEIINYTEINNYTEKNLVVFSVNIEQTQINNGKWKKKPTYPKKWTDFTLENTFISKKYNGLALLTGKINNIIVIDVDNVDHWNSFLEKNKQKEPKTVKAISGSGGLHFYFKYENHLESIKSKDHCFGKEYDIDVKTNGGCIIIPPSKYFNKNFNTEVKYKWERSILEYDPKPLPKWMEELLLSKKDKKLQKIKKYNYHNVEVEEINTTKENNTNSINISDDIIIDPITEKRELNPEDSELNFSINDIETILNMIKDERNNNYNDWVNIGMCLHNINPQYLLLWMKWSQQSEKYENGACEEKWKSFKKNKDGLKIGSLLLWAKQDNPIKYEEFMKKKKMNKMILSKYPNDKLILGDRHDLGDKNYYINLKNKECFIKGEEHIDMPNSMYIDILDKFMTIKCRHPECYGKKYPCDHILMNKNEMNIAFNGDITININNGTDDELIEFQQIDIYEDQILNELVYNSLNGEPSKLAHISYFFFKNNYNYGEDNNWYLYEDHKWKNIGQKNMFLRSNTETKLEEIYKKIIKYYKENDNDKNKLKALKNVIKTFGETYQKNNIMTELSEIFLLNKNKKKDFTKKLNSNKFLIGFNNGVYDLQNFEFRDGKPEDYITLSVGYDYQDKHTEKYKDLIQFLEDIQPNKEERDYMLTYLSIGLVGNLLELFTILTGCGRNGKSKLIELLKLTLGDYCGSVQSQLFTRPRPDANGPDPGLLSLAKKRVVFASEPEKNSKLNSGFIKFITGRDSTTLRNCHSSDMIEFSPDFITLLICNDIPECDDFDNAFSKRLRCINFPTEFVNEPIKINQKKIDVNINKNFDYWKIDFMLLLIEKYKKYSESHELKTTENILKWTTQYKETTDIYLHFLDEKTEHNNDGHIHCSVLYEEFKIWFKNNNPGIKIPNNKEFVNNLKKHKDVMQVRVEDRSQLGIKHLKLC